MLGCPSQPEGKPVPKLSAIEKQQFEEQGYLLVPRALSNKQIERLCIALDRLTADEPNQNHNTADILGKSDAFLDLIDLPTVLPKVRALLGENIWVNHSHFNINQPSVNDELRSRTTGYGWHRDGGAINSDVPPPAPLLSIKVGFYLTDLSQGDRGQTHIIKGSHKTDEKVPGMHEMPLQAEPLRVNAGTAIMYDRRTIHSLWSPNKSDITRKVVFVQYAFRWISALDAMSVEHLREQCSPLRLQLLGLNSGFLTTSGAQGRSDRYYASAAQMPLTKTMRYKAMAKLKRVSAKLGFHK